MMNDTPKYNDQPNALPRCTAPVGIGFFVFLALSGLGTLIYALLTR